MADPKSLYYCIMPVLHLAKAHLRGCVLTTLKCVEAYWLRNSGKKLGRSSPPLSLVVCSVLS